MVDASILDFLLTILTLFYAAIFHLCLQEMRNFPSVAITNTRDIQIANYVRLFTIIVSGLTLSYGLMMFGHYVGLGGLETLKDSNIKLIFVALGLVAIGSFFASRIIDQKIYVEIGRYENALNLSLAQLKQKIRETGSIKATAKSNADRLEKAIEKDNKILDKVTAAHYEESRKADNLSKEKKSITKSIRNLRAMMTKTKQENTEKEEEIKDIQQKLKADVIMFDLVKEQTREIDESLQRVKDKKQKYEKILQPLMEKKTQKQKQLTLSTKEYQICVDSIDKCKKEIVDLRSKIDNLKKKTKEAQKRKSDLALDHEYVLQELSSTEDEIKIVQKEIGKYQTIIEENNIAELTLEQQKEVKEMLKKQTEVHFTRERDGDDKIFEN